MSIAKQLIERYGGSKTNRGEWYHGTSSKLRGIILAEGLVPNPKVRSWDSDPDASIYSPSRASFEGVYVTQNLMTAISSAGRTMRRDNKSPNNDYRQLIVCMELQSRSLVADEDSIHLRFPGSPGDQLRLWYYVGYLRPFTDEEAAQSYGKARSEWADESARMLTQSVPSSDILRERVRKLLYDEGWVAFLTRNAAYTDMKDYSSRWMWYRQWPYEMQKNPETIPALPSKEEGESTYRSFIDRLTRTLKPIARHNSDSFTKTGRLLQPVRYSGSNRITCVVELARDYDLLVHYGEPSEKFLHAYSVSMSDKFQVIHARSATRS